MKHRKLPGYVKRTVFSLSVIFALSGFVMSTIDELHPKKKQSRCGGCKNYGTFVMGACDGK